MLGLDFEISNGLPAFFLQKRILTVVVRILTFVERIPEITERILTFTVRIQKTLQEGGFNVICGAHFCCSKTPSTIL